MTQRIAFGVIGGYGATGRNAVAELWRSCPGDILIGGRDQSKASALAAEFAGRVAAARVDVLDQRSLDEFCSRCSIILNCASPVMILEDRVAQAALRSRCHYVDAASLLIVKERMLPQSGLIADAGLSFVLSAGWLPGITELAPLYADAVACTKMDVVDSSIAYIGDTGAWSDHAMRDAAWLVRRLGQSRRGYFERGKWVQVGVLKASREMNLGGRIGRRCFFLFSNPEFSEVGARLNDCTVRSYTCIPGWRSALAATLIALLPLSEIRGSQLLRDAFHRERLPVGGFVVVDVCGRSQNKKLAMRVQVVYEDGREYWINGLVLATVARLIYEKKGVRDGVHYLPDAVNPVAFMAELRKAGVEQNESFAPAL